MQSLCEQKGCGELVNEWKRETESEDVYEKQGINGWAGGIRQTNDGVRETIKHESTELIHSWEGEWRNSIRWAFSHWLDMTQFVIERERERDRERQSDKEYGKMMKHGWFQLWFFWGKAQNDDVFIGLFL